MKQLCRIPGAEPGSAGLSSVRLGKALLNLPWVGCGLDYVRPLGAQVQSPKQQIELLVSAQFIPWELTPDGLHFSGVCDSSGGVVQNPALVEDFGSIQVVGRDLAFSAWLEGEERTDRVIADIPFPDCIARCHLYRIRDDEAGIYGVAVPLTANSSRRVAGSSGELSRIALIEDTTLEAIRAVREDKRLACCILRIPEVFKVQTALGSTVAELFQREIALRLKHAMDGPNLVYELGVEAFAILCPIEQAGEAGIEALNAKLARIEEQTFGYHYDVDSMMLRACGGIGYAVLPDDASDVSELLRGAEIASLRAIQGDSDRTTVRCPAAALEEVRENLVLASEFYEALLAGQIQPYIQPIVETTTGRWVGGEVLTRWDHPVIGHVSPPRFVRLAEEYGYISDLTVHIIRSVAGWIQENGLEGLFLSFNISPRDFQLKEIGRLRNEVVGQELNQRAKVAFEIVESTVIEVPEIANAVIASVKDCGIGFALDDFGTGYSSISLLQSLDINYLKIDRSFTNGIAQDQRKKRLLRAISYAADAFELKMVAEGVETREDLEIILEFGIELTQGFYFSKPLSLTDFATQYFRNNAQVA